MNEWWLISEKARSEIQDLCVGEPYRCPNRLKMILVLIETVHETDAVPKEFEDEIPEETPEVTLKVPEEGPEEAPEEGGAF